MTMTTMNNIVAMIRCDCDRPVYVERDASGRYVVRDGEGVSEGEEITACPACGLPVHNLVRHLEG
jgi:hypothetical protein